MLAVAGRATENGTPCKPAGALSAPRGDVHSVYRRTGVLRRRVDYHAVMLGVQAANACQSRAIS
jgi:hypothetical protein